MGYAQRLRAIAAYQDALRVDPDYADAYYRLGLMALMEKDMPMASQAIEGLSRLEPDSGRSRELLKKLFEFYGINPNKQIEIKKR
jgi:tetratricopeptide (TPR) repeat protein